MNELVHEEGDDDYKISSNEIFSMALESQKVHIRPVHLDNDNELVRHPHVEWSALPID